MRQYILLPAQKERITDDVHGSEEAETPEASVATHFRRSISDDVHYDDGGKVWWNGAKILDNGLVVGIQSCDDRRQKHWRNTLSGRESRRVDVIYQRCLGR